jgi:hypothetical protein
VFYHLPCFYLVIPRAGLVFTHFDPEDENGADSFFQVLVGIIEAPTPWVTDLDNVSQTGVFSFAYIVADKITGLQSYSFCHSDTFSQSLLWSHHSMVPPFDLAYFQAKMLMTGDGDAGVNHQSRSTDHRSRESLCVRDHKVTNLKSFRHSLTFPRQARLLASFLRSLWRPAPEVWKPATATRLRLFGFLMFLRFAIAGLLLTK